MRFQMKQRSCKRCFICCPHPQRNFSYISVYYGENWQNTNMHCNLTIHNQGVGTLQFCPCKLAYPDFRNRYGPVISGEMGPRTTLATRPQKNRSRPSSFLRVNNEHFYKHPYPIFLSCKCFLKHLQTMRIAKSVSE